MPELNDLPEIDPADVTDDDFLLIYDNSAPSNKSKKATRANFLRGVAREAGSPTFLHVETDTSTTNDATTVNQTITTSLIFDAAATLQKMYSATASVVTAGTGAGASETLSVSIPNIATSDFVNLSFSGALPDGLMAQAWVSAPDTVSIKFYNATSSAIAGATYTARIAVMRFA